MLINKVPVIVLFLSFFAFSALSQEMGIISNLNEQRNSQEKKGMLILGSWALGNMVWGGLAANNSIGREKGFHQMNLYWNSVNLLIAGLGYYRASKTSRDLGLWESINEQQQLEKVLLVNAALDAGYMAGGLYLMERGKNLDREQWVGFGQSVILQGAFLMAFDLVMYRFQRQNSKALPKFFEQLSISGSGISYKVIL
jgi:hypothetical protein